MPKKKHDKHDIGHPGKPHVWSEWRNVTGNMQERTCVRERSFCDQVQRRKRPNGS